MEKKSFSHCRMTLCGVIIINTCLKINPELVWDNVLERNAIEQGMWGMTAWIVRDGLLQREILQFWRKSGAEKA